MYIYPDNLKSKAVLWLWQLRDIGVIGIGCLISVFALAQLGFLLPIVATALYAFLTIRFDDTSILDFIRYACAFPDRAAVLRMAAAIRRPLGTGRKAGGQMAEKKKSRAKAGTRQLINTRAIDYSLQTYGTTAGIFIIKPSNISVLSASISARIYALMTVLKAWRS